MVIDATEAARCGAILHSTPSRGGRFDEEEGTVLELGIDEAKHHDSMFSFSCFCFFGGGAMRHGARGGVKGASATERSDVVCLCIALATCDDG